MFTKLAGKFAQATVEATTVINTPWAIDTLAASVGDIVTAGVDILLRIGECFVDALSNVRDIATQVGDYVRFPVAVGRKPSEGRACRQACGTAV